MNSTSSTIHYRSWTKKGSSGLSWFLFVFVSLFGIHPSSFAQIGRWQSHVSYQSGQSVAVVGNNVYAATQNGFFFYDKTTNETTTLDKTADLSDAGISRLLYLADQKKLLIAYRNGNLDFLSLTDTGEPGTVTNLNTIVLSPTLPVLRGINHLNRIGTAVYLSTDFGLVVLDLVRNEIRDTYFSRRTDGSPLPIFQTAATADSLYALSAPLRSTDANRQLRAVRFSPNVNIADPANWLPLLEPGPGTESIVVNQGRLSASVNKQGVYERQTGKWVLTRPLPDTLIRQFPAVPDGLIIATDKAITLTGSGSFDGPLLTTPREVTADGGTVWVADTKSGLLLGKAGQFERISPEGPTRDQFASLYAYPKMLVALPNSPQDAGTLLKTQVPADVFSVPNNRWLGSLGAGITQGFNSAAYLPAERQLYLSGFGNGLWRQNEGQTAEKVTLPATIRPFINCLAAGLTGNLWFATGQAAAQQATLHVRQADGMFNSFPIISQPNIVQIVPDDNGFLWLRPGLGGGLIVVDPQTSRIRYLSTQKGEGSLLTSSVRTLVKDRNGAIWVGTDLGPMVFDNPAAAFDAIIDAQPPLLNGRRLLANEIITALAVDGGNRKWIGTQSGLYHVAPDGSQLLDTFNAANSPLPGNTIQALAIEPVSGKIFIHTATDNRSTGLVSYQGSATEPADALSNLTIFPNPVRPDFTGTVGIKGLTDNATVKILNAGGQLVFETRSQGGTATWNLHDYRGRMAQTGVYLVVIVTAEGTEGLAGKLAVVR